MSRSALKKDRFLNGDTEAPKTRAAVQPGGGDPDLAVPVKKPVVAPVTVAAHPLFAPRPDSPFADKLKQALQPTGPKQES